MVRMLQKKTDRPPFITIYGREGVGKTTLASLFPDPFVIDAEERYYYDLPHASVRSYDDVKKVMFDLINHPCKTVVVDSVDSLQEKLYKKVMAHHNLKSFAQNYREATSLVCQELGLHFFQQLRDLNRGGKIIVCVCHPRITEMQDALVIGKWNAYTLKLAESKELSLSARLKEISDGLFFLAHSSPVAIEKGVAQEGLDIRQLFTEYSPCYDAKNIWGLPDPVIGKDVYEIYDIIEKYLFADSPQQEEFDRSDAFRKALDLAGGDKEFLKSVCDAVGVSFKSSAREEIESVMRRLEIMRQLKSTENDPIVLAALIEAGAASMETASEEQLNQALNRVKEKGNDE